jgi:hypothetical protein
MTIFFVLVLIALFLSTAIFFFISVDSSSFRKGTWNQAKWEDSNGMKPVNISSSTFNSSVQRPNDWAFVSYATNDIYACNNLILFESIRMHLPKGEQVPADFVSIVSSGVSDKYRKKLTESGIKIEAVETFSSSDTRADPTWKNSLTKLHLFQLEQYKRVVYADADALAVKDMLPLFNLPSSFLWAPRAYWLEQPLFQSTLLVAEPDKRYYDILVNALDSQKTSGKVLYDMDILNEVFKDYVGLLPGSHVLLNGDLKAGQKDHSGAVYGDWVTNLDAQKNAYLIHFSESPRGGYGKPWHSFTHKVVGYQENISSPNFIDTFELYWKLKSKLC